MKVLVVEDDDSFRYLVNAYLTDAGHVVEQAEGGRVALEMLDACDGEFDAVITDLKMPDGGGLALYENILWKWPELARRTILMTGNPPWEIAEINEQTGRPVLGKPFRLLHLLQLLGAFSFSRESA